MEYTGATGIFFGYVQSSTIQHNLIANTSYSAMTIGATAPSLCRGSVGSGSALTRRRAQAGAGAAQAAGVAIITSLRIVSRTHCGSDAATG